tara:strand:+ start:906 stop:1109 length:204 start_codon:yes stop_codon:yes gene_type:complete
MYVLRNVNQSIEDYSGKSYTVPPENSELTVAHVIAQLIEATVVEQTAAAILKQLCTIHERVCSVKRS